MQAMDCFVFPSKFEGLGIAGVETQVMGLPCYFSDVIPPEIVMTSLVYFLSLKMTGKQWAEAILKNRENVCYGRDYEIIQHGYDIQVVVHKLEQFYQHSFI